MASHNYIKLQNQGNIISNLRLLAEMANAKDNYADKHGYFTKRAIAQIAASALLVTSGSAVGQELESLWNNVEIEEGKNSLLQNTKARMQILRTLGLVSADYDAEMYAITELGEAILQETFGKTHNIALLRELFMCISTTTEIYEFNCDIDFDCYIGYQICYALANLDYKISTREMPCITTYSIRDISDFINDARNFRNAGLQFPLDHPHAPRRQNGELIKNPSNLTRSINQILRVCGIIEGKTNNNFYICTSGGRSYVDEVNKRFHKQNFLTSYKFRKLNLIEQKSKCKEGLANIYHRAKVCTEGNETNLVFSPYQLLPETCVQWLFEQTPRKPPVTHENRINVINNEITSARLRLRANYAKNEKANNYNKDQNKLVEEMLLAKREGILKEDFIESLIRSYKQTDKAKFYPFVHSLLRIIGLDCQGEVGRYDAYTTYKGHVIPVEIKSFTETPCYNLKGLRQAIENKVCSYNENITNDLDYSTLVVGFNHPDSESESFQFIDNAKEKLGIKIVACDTPSLIKMATRVIWDNMVIKVDELFTQHGIINE